jgi:hypothetical protein
MVPEPVTVSVLLFVPFSVPGPLTILKVTGLPEPPPVAVKVIGATPYVTGVAGAKPVIVCDVKLLTVSDATALVTLVRLAV